MDENRIKGNNDGKTYPIAWRLCVCVSTAQPTVDDVFCWICVTDGKKHIF